MPPSTLSGHVYRDDNNDGVRQNSEPLIPGATIRLFDGTGAQLGEVTTDSQGYYQFTSLRKGTYRVEEVTPNGYLDGKESIGRIAGRIVGELDGTDSIKSIVLPSGMNGSDYDFGEILPASIAGNVYEDANGDCIRDPGEINLAGVVIEILNAQGQIVGTTITDSEGNYRFDGLIPGQYTLRETQPAGYIQGGQIAGSAGGNATMADIISAIALGAGVQATDYDFCEQRVGSLEGQVFADLNEDCIFDSDESPIEGVRIELLDAEGNFIETTSTDNTGRYRFINLKPGIYSVREIQPVGYFQGNQMAPEGVADTSTVDLLANISLSSGESVSELDFCEVPPATIAGFVFQDGDAIETKDGLPPLVLKGLRDGVRSAGDAPIGNVVLELRTRTGQRLASKNAMPGIYSGDTIRVVTDSSGYYEFRGLRPGAYHVYQTQPTGYFDGRDTAGSIGGFAINADDSISDQDALNVFELLSLDSATSPGNDAILMLNLQVETIPLRITSVK